MERDLSRSLHALIARMDRAADRILRIEQGVSLRRFLALYAVRELSGPTQRELAEWMGVTEPSVSRMTRVLAEEGLLEVRTERGEGNRRQLTLTSAGSGLVVRCGALLEDRFAALVDSAGVSYADYSGMTRRLLAGLEDGGARAAQRAAAKVVAPKAASRRSRRAS
jgi:DNA-binding MarR family transcriptional regulator